MKSMCIYNNTIAKRCQVKVNILFTKEQILFI